MQIYCTVVRLVRRIKEISFFFYWNIDLLLWKIYLVYILLYGYIIFFLFRIPLSRFKKFSGSFDMKPLISFFNTKREVMVRFLELVWKWARNWLKKCIKTFCKRPERSQSEKIQNNIGIIFWMFLLYFLLNLLFAR